MFRFTIRELAMLTAIVALALGWGIDRSYCVFKATERDYAWLRCLAQGLSESDEGRPYRITTPSGKTFVRDHSSNLSQRPR